VAFLFTQICSNFDVKIYLTQFMRHLPIIISGLLLGVSSQAAEIADLRCPLDIPLYLSGNFGELRNNHFHSGLDFKTQGRTGLPVHSVADGYVSRIVVSPWGFGRAVYITHPSLGLTTVYGHLENFSSKIDTYARNKQYANEQFNLDISLNPDELPVTRGEVIALSGNAGSSGGPHLHMDVRDSATGETLDPMPYFKQYLADTVSPEVRSISLYPISGKGVVNNKSSQSTILPSATQKRFSAWGEVVPAIKAYDKMSGTTNIYGVKFLTLTVDGKPIYNRVIDRYDFKDTKAVNTLVDYSGVVNNGSWTMWTKVPDSEPLASLITTENNGIITIDEEREYPCEWILKDCHGNESRIAFTIVGENADIPNIRKSGDRLSFNGKNRIVKDGVTVEFPENTFYEDIYMTISSTNNARYKSPIFTIGDKTIPISGEYSISIDIPDDTLADKNQYLMVRLNGTRATRVDATYKNGKLIGTPSSLGTFTVTTDTTAPTITPLQSARWGKTGIVSFKIGDNLSGVTKYRGEIDGKFALFELDGKSGKLTFVMDSERFNRSKNHTVTLTVTDACGNSSNYKGNFTW
jgi:hypothetical protein